MERGAELKETALTGPVGAASRGGEAGVHELFYSALEMCELSCWRSSGGTGVG